MDNNLLREKLQEGTAWCERTHNLIRQRGYPAPALHELHAFISDFVEVIDTTPDYQIDEDTVNDVRDLNRYVLQARYELRQLEVDMDVDFQLVMLFYIFVDIVNIVMMHFE